MQQLLSDYGIVHVIERPGTTFPRFTLAETGYDGSKSGYFVLGGFAVANNGGVVLAPTMFLRSSCKNRLARKSAQSWATDIKQWVRFVEAVQAGKRRPPYEIDLMVVDETTLKQYRDFLTRIARSRSGQQLATSSVRNKLMRVCVMYQWFADNGWYHGDLGPRAESSGDKFSIQPVGLLAHIHKRSSKRSHEAPMGSKLALGAESRRARVLPRALTNRDQRSVEKALTARLVSVASNSPRHDQHLRDELIFNVGRFVGLRVENLSNLPLAKILALRLGGLRLTDTLPIPMIGKGRRKIYPSFPVALLLQMQTYAETARQRAVNRGGKKNPPHLFVAHVGPTTGNSIGKRAVQSAIYDIFIDSGLTKLVPLRSKYGDLITDDFGGPLHYAASKFSVHALRHTCAIRTFYAFYAETKDREQAMRKVQDQLCHSDFNVTEKKYAELTRRFSTWKTFCEGLDNERDADVDQLDDGYDYSELTE